MNLRIRASAWLAAAWLLAAAQPAGAGTILGSAHDFSAASWSGGQICVACHASHNASGGVTAAPLWNHAATNAVYTLYSSPSLVATMNQPSASSKLCLSCHDGTVAVDSFGRNLGTTFISSANKLGTNLNVHHPSSFLYDTSLAARQGSLFDPTTKTVTLGSGSQTKTGTITATMLFAGMVECSSCHDVHNTFTAVEPGLLKISKSNKSAICFACHNF
jgi:predicted CXXCH cytochrome family protein